MLKSKLLIVMALALCLLTSCPRSSYDHIDHELFIADKLAEYHIDSAMSILAHIRDKTQSPKVQYRCDLIYIKATDRAYMPHTTDSIIRRVIAWYSKHGPDSLQTQALYYGGRVYSDLGDYLEALSCFSEASKRIDPSTDNRPIASRIMSQYGRLLDKLRLHDEAIACLRQAIDINRRQSNLFSLAYNSQLLGSIYMKIGRFDSAAICIDTAITLARGLTDSDLALMQAYRAELFNQTGDLANALGIIRSVVGRTRPSDSHFTLAVAADVYYKAGIVDTAIMYANQLATLPGSNNKLTALYILSDSTVASHIISDSICNRLNSIYTSMQTLSERTYKSLAKATNRSLDSKASSRPEFSRPKFWMIAIIGSFLLITSMIWIYRVHGNYKLPHRKCLNVSNTIIENNLNPEGGFIGCDSQSKYIEVRDTYSEHEVVRIINEAIQDNDTYPVSVLNVAPIMAELKQRLVQQRCIVGNDRIWHDLEGSISSICPRFFTIVNLLCGPSLTNQQRQLIMLIKVGMSPSECSILLAKTPSGISYHRKAIRNLFNKLIVADYHLDHLIRVIK